MSTEPHLPDLPAPSDPSDLSDRSDPSDKPDTTTTDILLHVCCAPCATHPVLRLRAQGLRPLGWWYNPNIHPWSEHEARRTSLVGYGERVGLPLLWEAGYDLVAFLRQLAGRERREERCALCYTRRLGRAARAARSLGLAAFTTTLLVSPYQDHALLRQVGEAAATAAGIEFYYEDFRRGWGERGRLTRQYGLYRQQYCGCIFSEYERYARRPITAALDTDENG